MRTSGAESPCWGHPCWGLPQHCCSCRARKRIGWRKRTSEQKKCGHKTQHSKKKGGRKKQGPGNQGTRGTGYSFGEAMGNRSKQSERHCSATSQVINRWSAIFDRTSSALLQSVPSVEAIFAYHTGYDAMRLKKEKSKSTERQSKAKATLQPNKKKNSSRPRPKKTPVEKKKALGRER